MLGYQAAILGYQAAILGYQAGNNIAVKMQAVI